MRQLSLREMNFSPKLLSCKTETRIPKLPNVRGQGLNCTTFLPTWSSPLKSLFHAFELLGWEKIRGKEDLGDGSVSCGCHTNCHKLRVLKEHKLIFHTVLETRSLKSRCQWVHTLSQLQEAADHPRHSWACGWITSTSASIFTLLPSCLCLSSLCLLSLDLGLTLIIQEDLLKILNHICKYPSTIHRFQGLGHGHTFLGTTIQPIIEGEEVETSPGSDVQSLRIRRVDEELDTRFFFLHFPWTGVFHTPCLGLEWFF